ncbi:hypothetical protein MG293_008114 [Ovis ammon polii]|uniref:Uncharacterized protein n=1 Tax=Ovis ammon polii TaxID=230172 RepID=A0AAD4YB88_OVIAM|nr:hypothetical protein MG293_008114 [Ovis ammon polii]
MELVFLLVQVPRVLRHHTEKIASGRLSSGVGFDDNYQNLKKRLYSLFAYFLTYKQENGVVFQYHYYLKKEAQESRELTSTVKGKISVRASHSSKGGFVVGSYAKRLQDVWFRQHFIEDRLSYCVYFIEDRYSDCVLYTMVRLLLVLAAAGGAQRGARARQFSSPLLLLIEKRASSEDWVNPIECVPGQPYCGQTALSSAEAQLQGSVTQEDAEKEPSAAETKQQLSPYAAVGECRRENCACLQVLHPLHAAQRSQHIKSCIEAHEKDMELSFVVQHSKDMVCGICMEVVYKKARPSESASGSSSTAVSSVFASVGVLSNLRARS